MNRNAWLAAATVATLLGTTGCTAERPAGGVVPTGAAPVIVPGRPGEPAATATPGQTLLRAAQPNAADVRFAEAMIGHHRAALAMAALVPGRTGTPPIVAAAARVRVSQEAEIGWLTRWLARLGRRAPHGHDHDLAALRGLRAAAFDRAYLAQMIEHHEGAVRMAADVLRKGSDPGIRRLAADIDSGQTAEIVRMRELLRGTRAGRRAAAAAAVP
ncbi:MAG: DUF305 domain-containing protein [Thermoactinospora sp.]|nr:DUF305 domain-containing protein [Thermoactinospora sp.]